MTSTVNADPLAGLHIFERGWLSSNNVLIDAAADEPGAVLIDSSHVNHAEQTVALLRQALGDAPLARVVNTHLHSDHCGGNASVQRAFAASITIPPGEADAVRRWDTAALSFHATGQRIERFAVDDVLKPGDVLRAGGRDWQALAAPGHDPHSLILFDAEAGVLISADGLWEHGFGVVFPELVGEPGFDDVAAVLELIAALPVRVVIPGHGAPFRDVAAALARARARLAGFRADPARHARHAAKVLIKYHLMEEREQALDALLDWAVTTPLLGALWARRAAGDGATPRAWADALVADLVASGALQRRDGAVADR